ncbi:cobalamin biosynthesis protein CobQ [Cognatishimia sp. MH4019]|uniref:cobalamin biosynthesis protein CobQ n=1 Tax=Cognatishimia sp. MH4019 TaxID=2854030 RepID=UPI001CD26022|nr:cobalamin biosynthesis protein CobQ [Cognatishimia sp. MH4019]
MNTPAHLIFGLAAFSKRGKGAVTAAALMGSLLPDLSLYLLAGSAIFVLGIEPETVFRDLYYSPTWQTIFQIDNSFLIWGALLAVALWRRSAWGVALTGAALLHLAFDFPLHHDDGRAHFWPVSDWVFESPVSYWDPNQYGGLVSVIEIAACLALSVVLWRRFPDLWPRIGITALMVAQAAPVVMWSLMLGA